VTCGRWGGAGGGSSPGRNGKKEWEGDIGARLKEASRVVIVQRHEEASFPAT